MRNAFDLHLVPILKCTPPIIQNVHPYYKLCTPYCITYSAYYKVCMSVHNCQTPNFDTDHTTCLDSTAFHTLTHALTINTKRSQHNAMQGTFLPQGLAYHILSPCSFFLPPFTHPHFTSCTCTYTIHDPQLTSTGAAYMSLLVTPAQWVGHGNSGGQGRQRSGNRRCSSSSPAFVSIVEV